MLLMSLLFFSFISLAYPLNMSSVTLPIETINIDDTIDNELITRVIGEMYSIDDYDDIYFYIYSNGGSVHAGNKLIEQMKFMQNNDREIYCIGHKFISMAFVIFQYCTHRLSLETSVAMQHQMSLGLEGSIENINGYFNLAKKMYKDMVKYQAKRLDMKVDKFRDKVKTDWWTFGSDIVKNNISDALVIAGCESYKYCPFI